MRIGITGHRGLPSDVAAEVRAGLVQHAKAYGAAEFTAISCIADGPDAWWAQIALDAGARVEVVIPASEYRESLPEWHHADYDQLLSKAADVHHTGLTQSTSEAHQAGSEILVGLSDHLLAVWDGKPARGYGGTADVVAYARRVGVPVTVIWPDGASR
ncbi:MULTISPECIES: hypothetical protein [unclassified Streptomyces]|uniref:hypothetical protein n=1 Tax=unclassified Streptomyces TaxID=2593676 RepID=UPI00081D3DA0|nr:MULTISPECIES: hypothetical protein [unclassified Streptomyces]MYZ37059.1 hypothetical protein [Streptomyces sp. SID4917]SCF88372.1 hypothetical protein GA0115259_104192 [Streptomyces sp. MnatMP-M17]